MREYFPQLGQSEGPFVGTASNGRPALVPVAPGVKRRPIKERSARMLTLLFVLVLALHLGGALWLLHSVPEPAPPAKPLEMKITMVKVTAPKPFIPPPPPAPANLKPPSQKKPQVKPKLKAPRIVPTPAEFAPTEQVVNQASPQPAVVPAEISVQAKTDPVPVSEPDYRAHYARNPAPVYPTRAQNQGWQGKVLLRVVVSVEGLSETVTVDESSGYDILDESALIAVKQWQFTPAMQGDTPLASTVLVPIIFTLRD